MSEEKKYDILEFLIHLYFEQQGIEVQTKNPLTNEWK